jgi:hypothetical protein
MKEATLKNVSRLITLLLLALTTSAWADDARWQKFIASAVYQELVSHKLDQYPAPIFQRCPSLVLEGSKVTVIEPATFAADGNPTAGFWHQAFPVTGCGNDTVLNLFFVALPDGKIDVAAGLSGTTVADLLLQKDAMSTALGAAARPETKDCKEVYVLNTDFVGMVGEAKEGVAARPWDELWTISVCQKRVIVTMHFVPGKVGTTFHAALSEAKFLGP